MPAPAMISSSIKTSHKLEPDVQPRAKALKFASVMLGFNQTALSGGEPIPFQSLGWIAYASLTASVGLMLAAQAQIAGMHNGAYSLALYWGGTAAIAFPAALRIAWPYTPPRESLVLILIMGMGLYGVKILHSPLHFSEYDEFLHWNTALNIMEEQHLFGANSLLPISPLYPGLEIVATALSNLSGLSIFACGLLVIGIGKVIFLSALFFIAEALTGSPRVAALACIVFMSNANFSTFHATFAYESLAYVLMALTILTALRLASDDPYPKLHLLTGAAFAIVLAVTHHLTSYLTTAFLAAFTLLKSMEKRPAKGVALLALLAGVSLTAGAAWWRFTGGTGSGYLGPVLQQGFEEFFALLTSPGHARAPFQGADGAQQPLLSRYTAIASYLIICLGLCTGFFRSLSLAGGAIQRPGFRITWTNSGLVLFTLLTLLYPFSILLRLTQSGWEIGNRLGTFASLGVCIVVAIAIAGLWQGRSSSRLRTAAIASILTIMVLGGGIVGWGANAVNYPYRVSADARSVEPLGIGAAEWSRLWLGPGQRFATDRINQLLLATYGRQIAITSLQTKAGISGILFAKELTSEEVNVIKETATGYVMIDLRLTTALPTHGVYVDSGEIPEVHRIPPEPAALLKFDKLRGVSRPFDNGATIIYDVRSLYAIRSSK